MARSRILLALLLSACSKDVVLPDSVAGAICGNGQVEAGEQCDVASPGCAACQVVPTWRCSRASCEPICGDGVACAPLRRDADCDVTGWWAVRETNYTRESVLNSVQTSSNWFVYRLEQAGDAFTVGEALDCGIHVTGSATVDTTPGTLRGMIYRNRMDAAGPHGARKGTAKAIAGGCSYALERWYKVRGAVETVLPADFATRPALADLPPLPSVKDPVTSTEFPAGAEDPDGDGIPGAAFLVTGIANGIRDTVQRDWKEFATLPGAPLAAGALTWTVPGSFDLDESILRVTECGSGCGLLAAAAHVAQDFAPRVTMTYIGRDLGGVRVREVVADAPRKSLDADLTTCAKVRLLLPHEGGTP